MSNKERERNEQKRNNYGLDSDELLNLVILKLIKFQCDNWDDDNHILNIHNTYKYMYENIQ